MHVKSLSLARTSNTRCAMSGPPSFFSSSPAPAPPRISGLADTSSRTGCCSTSDSSLASSSPAVAERSMHCTPFSQASTTFLMSSSYPKLSSRSASSSTSSSSPEANAPLGKRFSRTHSAARAGVAMRIFRRRARELAEHGGGAPRRGELARAQGRRALPEEERRFLLHLMRELARGHEHERARVGGRRASHRGVAAGDNLVDRGEQIRRGLAAPGVRASHHVLALQHERDRLGLHRRRRAVPLLRQRAEQPRVQPEGHPAVACVARLGTHRRRREGVERGRGCTSAESGALSQWAAAAKHNKSSAAAQNETKRAAAMRRRGLKTRNAS